ncbi:MAG: hypothetical protein BWK75_05240 [Candidatus Altiarchaeales archaeon A3]|nr:MAG: hypothetical protein BWK75_05240 [Candidatus Altiarchaeales archaeon A3]
MKNKGIFQKDNVFNIAIYSTLFFLVLYIIIVIFSITTYIHPDTFFSLLFSDEIVFAIKLSLITATLAALLSVLIGIPASYALSRANFKGKNIVDSILDLPIVVSPIALGAALLIFFNTSIGTSVENYIKFTFAFYGIVLAQFTIVSALFIRLMKSTFDDMNPRYEEVARTLGCSKFQAFFKVIIPLSKNGLINATILTWARAIGEFGATVTLAGAMQFKTETLPIAIFLNLSTADVDKAMVVVLILILISFFALTLIRIVSKNNKKIT